MRKFLLIGLVVLVLVAGGAYAYYTYVYLPGQEPAGSTITTAQVRRGDLVISVSGSGTLSPASEVSLGFPASGYLDAVLVDVGDRVQEGDVLARLATDDLELAVAEAEIALRQAQLDLADAEEGAGETELADARAALKSAQDALVVAQYRYSSALNSDLDAEVRACQIRFQWYADLYSALERGNAAPDLLEKAWDERASAETALGDALRRAELEQLDAWNQVEQARNRVYQAQEKLAALEDGPDANSVAQAELKAERAALALDEARAALEAAELRAPFTGVVVEVTAMAGEHVGTIPIITLVSLEEPLLRFWVEESDMGGVAVGNRVEILFEALPDEVFSGEVIRIDPALVTVGNTLAVQAWASVDVAPYSGDLLSGMNAEVEVISAESRDTLLVPVQALRELGSDQYAVFMVQPDGEMLLRPVEVGLNDFANAEILSGLEVGEVVSTGVAQNTETDVPVNEMQMPPGGPGERILEGH